MRLWIGEAGNAAYSKTLEKITDLLELPRRNGSSAIGFIWKPDAAGFSLVEMLVVIAVIAIIAAIAVPNIASVTASADVAKNQRNAQTLAGAYNAALASGLATNAASDVSSAIDLIAAGTNIVVGNTSHFFSVDGIAPPDRVRAQVYLDFSNGRLVYNPAP